jgi:hypothetical protein
VKLPRQQTGLTLAEAIIAMFVLLAGFAVVVRLFHTGIRYQTMVDDQSTAVMLAEREMERVRGWSRKVHSSPGSTQAFANWTGCPGTTAYVDPDFPGHSIRVQHATETILSPCSLFETIQPAGERRAIRESVRRVTVRVSWGSREHFLVSLVALPTGKPQLDPVTPEVQLLGSSNLARGERRTVNPSATNSDGRDLPDLFYNFSVQPVAGDAGGGNGAVDGPRDGREAVVRNCIYDVTPVSSGGPLITGYGGGRCVVKAIGRYRGRRVQGVSDAIDMQP